MTDFEILSLVIGIIGLVLTAMLVAYGIKNNRH